MRTSLGVKFLVPIMVTSMIVAALVLFVSYHIYDAEALVIDQQRFMWLLALSALAISLLMTVVFQVVLRFLVVSPINRITQAANTYLVDPDEFVSESNPITKLDIRTQDELEELSASLKTMENAIRRHLRSLGEANRKAESDSLTGLLNREAFEKRVHWMLENEFFAGYGAFIMIDLDDFKDINDTWGHHVGDEALTACAQAIQAKFRSSDLIARIGGDEFAVFYQCPASRELVEKRAEAVCNAVRSTRVGDGLAITASLGIALVGRGGGGAAAGGEGGKGTARDGGPRGEGGNRVAYQRLYVLADSALYDTKERGRDGWTIKLDSAP
ncbi:MAG: diguanylate cyclase [Coriobacteriaceae bacterium]|jgi:diguanylate cyclase (GGDEF)-like protein|nr:diguanylate cyclase [Coriobacteriaceae bacterium]